MPASSPQILAHRGASSTAPENTLAAFRQAMVFGADGFELDVTLSADGQVVVIHDNSLDRTTDGSGKVSDLALIELQTLDAGSWFGPQFAGERIPTLEQVLKEFGAQAFINIELKSSAHELVESTAALVQKHAGLDSILFSSFYPNALIRMHRRLPEAQLGFLTLPGLPGVLTRLIKPPQMAYHALNPHYQSITPRMVARARAHGRKVNAWTPNEADEFRRLIDLGVDGIITDHPRRALEIRAA